MTGLPIGTFTLENAGAQTLGAGVTTLGQSFGQGELPKGAGLTATIGGVAVPVQMDVKTTYPDGSVKMAVLSIARPELPAGQSVDVTLAKAAPTTVASAIDLAQVVQSHSFTLDLTIQGQATQHIDVLAALTSALAEGTASFWQKGELATQARVTIDIPDSSQRLVFDVTAFKDGGLTVDAQFNNDGAMGATGGTAVYSAKAMLDGQMVLNDNFIQIQYQNLHREFTTSAVDGGQGLGDPSAGWLNIRHDVAKLGQIGAVADYDLTITISDALLQSYGAAIRSADWDAPFAKNGVTPYMPMGGGRADIGITTGPTSAWLISQDPRAAAYALGQAETASTVPWSYYDKANGRWLNTDDYPYVWNDWRGGVGTPGDPDSRGVTQQSDWTKTDWVPETAHQPNLSFVPYLLTGERWILDNLNAQAAWNVMSQWPTVRQDGESLVVYHNQIRGAAWSLRQIEDAAYANPDGSFDAAYFKAVSASNWNYLVSQIPAMTAAQGEAHGWLDPGDYSPYNGGIATWQQDFFASTVISAASRGNAQAMTYLTWASNYLIGRFQHAADGLAVVNGAAYSFQVYDPATNSLFKTWAEIAAAMAARGELVNTAGNWEHGGQFDAAMATLAGIYKLTGSAEALAAYKQLIALNPPYASAIDLGNNPNFAVAIPGLYSDVIGGYYGNGQANTVSGTVLNGGGTGSGTAGLTPGATTGNDVLTLTAHLTGSAIDLGGGNDKLILASGGPNTATIRNAETIIGGGGDDDITLGSLAAGVVIELGGGSDRLTLASGGANTAIIGQVESILGGSGDDTITLSTAANGATIDLGAGADRLTLASTGPNTLTVRNIETLLGGRDGDTVTFGTAANGISIDLGAGWDTITLSSAGPNDVQVANAEVVRGGAAADIVRMATPLVNGRFDLGAAEDRLHLATSGPNSVVVFGTESIFGGAANDVVTLGRAVNGALVDLGGGDDRLVLAAAGPNSLSVANVETVIGQSGDDTLTMLTTLQNGFLDLGAGNDRLVLAAGVGNAVSVSGAESVVGGSAADRVTLQAPVSSTTIDLGENLDVLVLSGAGPNSLAASNVESIIGGSADDSVTLGIRLRGGTIDLAAGSDSLLLADGGNSLHISNTEIMVGGAGSDTVATTTAARLEGRGGNDVLTGSARDDIFVGGMGADTMTGGVGADRFIYASLGESGSGGRDVVADFLPGTDTLVFSGLLQGGFSWRGGHALVAAGTSQARFAASAKILEVDVNGDARADFEIRLPSVSLAMLNAADFAWS